MILLPFIFTILLFALLGGLNRLGLFSEVILIDAVLHHGLIMVSGFFGALISFERVKGLGSQIGLLIPAIKVLGVYLLISSNNKIALPLFILSDFSFLVLTSWGTLRYKAYREGFFLSLAVFCLLLADFGVYFYHLNERVLYLWFGFILWTIAGERLELSRFKKASNGAYFLLLFLTLIYFFGVVFNSALLIGLSFVSISIWFYKYDIVLKTLFFSALPRFTALSLVLGYLWLILTGLFLMSDGALFLENHDSIVHTFFLGFTMSMVMGHAPIIFPALTGYAVPFTKILYFPLLTFHFSVILRVVAHHTDFLIYSWSLKSIAVLLNSGAILLFFFLLIFIIVREKIGSK